MCATPPGSIVEGTKGVAMRTKPILLATDGSPTAGEAAREAFLLAKALDAPLVVTTAWTIRYAPYGPIPPGSIAALDVGVKEEAEHVLETIDGSAKELGLDVETVLRRGAPAEEICKLARERGAQLIVIGSHGWGAVRRFVFGSVSNGVLHDAPCPVLVAPATQEELRMEEEAMRETERVLA
jgi:nucleotide-binding universal stress UspA family protein